MQNFLKKFLGETFEEDLAKSEVGAILKPNANVAVFPQEMYIALQIVPRTVISLLVQKLKPLNPGQMCDIPWITDSGALHNIHIDKISSDLYNGEISGEGRSLAKFSYRSLPAVGLVIMSTYELYDKDTNKQDLKNDDIDYNKVQQIIDERVRLQCLVEEVVTKKLSEKEALQQLILQKIQDYLRSSEAIKQQINDFEEKQLRERQEESEKEEEKEEESDNEEVELSEDILQKTPKKGKLKEFLEKKQKQNSFKIVKKEIKCPDCDKCIYKGEDKITLCICYGEAMDSEIKVKKSKDGNYSLKFPKKLDYENIQMLISAIKGK